MSQVEEVFQRDNILSMLRAIAELHRNLNVTLKLNARNQRWPASRQGMVDAIAAIAWFLDKLDGFGDHAYAMNEFSSALADIDRGATHAIFATRRTGKPPDNTDLMCARARVAIAVAYMMHGTGAERSKDEIASEIAMRQPSLALIRRRMNNDKPLSASIVSWYESFNGGEVKNQEARDLYRTYQHLLVSARRSGKLSSMFLNDMAQQQLHLAAKFLPMTKAQALHASPSINLKKVPTAKSAKEGRRVRGV